MIQSTFKKRARIVSGIELELWETDHFLVRKVDGEKKSISGVIVDGYLCLYRKIWGKIVFIPCLSKGMLEQKGLLKKAQSIPGHEYWKHPDLMSCALRLGRNDDGTEVVDQSEEARRKQAQEPPQLVWYATDYEIFGDLYALSRRVDEATWRKIAPYMMKWEAEDPLMVEGPKRGWVARDPRRVEELLDVPHELRLFCQCEACVERKNRQAEERAERERRQAERQARRKELTRRLQDLVLAYGEKPKDCSEVERAEKILWLGSRGPDIYGGGSWFHLTVTHLWYVVNNGHDGDDWSLNNYRTGGAGAIAWRVERTEAVNQLIKEIEEFENECRNKIEGRC
ncbi:MAG: hypothetical protein V2G41_09505 [bacterium JZ-2024 1]